MQGLTQNPLQQEYLHKWGVTCILK